MKTNEKERAHIVKNTLYMLSVAAKSDPFGLAMIYLSYTAYNVYYHVVLPVFFLKTALSIVEESGSFRRFAITIGIAVGGKILIDLTDAITDYYLRIRFEIRCESRINAMLFRKAQQADLFCYENPDFFDRYTRASWVVEKGGFKRIIEGSAWTLGSIISYGIMVVYLYSLDPFMLLFTVCPVFVMLFRFFKNKEDFKKEKEMTDPTRRKDYVRRTVLLKDFAKEIKTTDIFTILKRNHRQAVGKSIAIVKKYGTRIAAYEMLSDLFGEIIPVGGSFVYGCIKLIGHGISLSDFSVFVSAIVQCRDSMKNLAYYFSSMQKQCLYVQAMRDFLHDEPQIKSGDRQPEDFESLEFRDVSFRYPGAEKDALSHISFRIDKGETVSVVGYNGAGKTTLSKLILRLYDATDGEILYNGVNIKAYDLAAYRKRFASVFQDYRIFALSAAENVLAREYDDKDKDAVENALLSAGIKQKIDILSHGMQTVLTEEFDENGASLSGGECQKLALARLFAKNTDVAVLDEPSSALDPIAEDRMYRELQKATAGKTVIYISHRLSSAARADRILVFSDGSLAEEGSHATLMQAGGIYALLFDLQASGYREEESTYA